MSADHDDPPLHGPGRVLLEAPPDTDVRELPELFAKAHRYECQRCGTQKFGVSSQCGECGGQDFERVPGPGERDE